MAKIRKEVELINRIFTSSVEPRASGKGGDGAGGGWAGSRGDEAREAGGALAELISVVGGAQGLETDAERMDCERLGGIFSGKGHGNGSFSVSSSLQYKGGRGEGVGVGVMGLGGVEGMGVGGGETPSKKSLSSWFRMPGSARKTKSVSSYTPSKAKEREGGGWGVLGGSLADVGGEVDCREFVRLLPVHNPDGSLKSDLNIAIIVPGLIVMGSPAAHGVGRGRGRGAEIGLGMSRMRCVECVEIGTWW